VRIKLLSSTFEPDGSVSERQHLTCFVIDDTVAIDAGSLAMASEDAHRESLRDIVLSHAHLDHIAGLPLFLDDLFATLTGPIRVHATRQVIDVLERDVFNWSIYPKFSELENEYGPVMEYLEFEAGKEISVRHLKLIPISVNHKVPSCGFLINDEASAVGLTGDTAEMGGFWDAVSNLDGLSALLIECAFPNELSGLAAASHHLTPSRLAAELRKFGRSDCPVFLINMKPMYRERILEQIEGLQIPNVAPMLIGRTYSF
jgi:cAMP phosphodiesterase